MIGECHVYKIIFFLIENWNDTRISRDVMYIKLIFFSLKIVMIIGFQGIANS